MMAIPEEISMIVSSDPSQGATNTSQDGSYFEIQLQDGLKLPKDALNINIAIKESTIWWSVPNIITGVNDKMYLQGSTEGSIKTRVELGYPAEALFNINDGSPRSPFIPTLVISNNSGLPVGAFQVGDIFEPKAGVTPNFEYTITSIVEDTAIFQEYTIDIFNERLLHTNEPFDRIRPTGIVQDYVITIPNGLYDLAGLNRTISRELELAGARNDPDPLITLNADEATQKVEIRFNYNDVSIDFSQPNTFAEMLGFRPELLGPYPLAPLSILAPDIAAFNQVNYFLIHGDLTNKGIRFNNNYNQTLGQVLIDVPPGSQITSKPINPAKVSATRTNLRFWLSDDKNRRINTNNEYWSARIVIHYLRPFVLKG